MSTGFDRLYAALDERGLIAPSWGAGVAAHCPGPLHLRGDSKPSLSIKEGDNGNALVYCFAGCTIGDIVDALGLSVSDLFTEDHQGRNIVATYVYEDEEGKPLYRVHRTDPKGFYQERFEDGQWKLGLKDVRRVLYRLPALREAVKTDTPIYIVEGEKDADTIQAVATGCVSTTALGGAGKWDDSYTEALKDAQEIYIVADRDDAGRKHAQLVLSRLPRANIVYPKQGKDVTDHIYAGYSLQELLPYEPVETDWDDWDEEAPDIDFLVPGIIPRGFLIWAYGGKETGKSMYLLHLATELSRRGELCTFYSEEMAKTTDRRRIARFGPSREFFRWKNGRGLNLWDGDTVDQVIRENIGASLIILDSYERVWAPPMANSNKSAVAFASVAKHIINETGATLIVIDHTGFPFRDDSGTLHDIRHARGSSAKEQQADMAILFTLRSMWEKGKPCRIRLENMKTARAENPFRLDLEIVDTPEGGLTVTGETLTDEGDNRIEQRPLFGADDYTEVAPNAPLQGGDHQFVVTPPKVDTSSRPEPLQSVTVLAPDANYLKRRRELARQKASPEVIEAVLLAEGFLYGP